MAFVVKDRVRQTSSTTGTGAFTLSSAVTGFQTFSVIGNGNTTSYTIVDASAGTWEVGIGTYTAAGTTLSRDVVLESSNNGNLVAFGAGVKDVFVTYPAEKAVYLDTANTFTANQIISVADNTNAALRITQAGTGNALLVEDSGNPDATPFVIDQNGTTVIGHTTSLGGSTLQVMGGDARYRFNTSPASGSFANLFRSRSSTVGTNTIVQSGDQIGNINFLGADGTSYISAAGVATEVDASPATGSMPGRLVFRTTAAGTSTPTERMRISSDGRVAIGSTGNAGTTLALGKSITGSTTAIGTLLNGAIQSDVTSAVHGFRSSPTTQATAFTLTELNHFSVFPQTYGAGSTVTNQYGFNVASTLTGATNNYGFYSNIASGTGRWNFYANGTAANFFGGNTIISVTDNTNAALRITQLGTGNALLVEDSGNPDATPFVIDSAGRTITGGAIARSYYLPAFSVNYTPSAQILGGDYTSSWAALAQWSTSTTNSGGAFLSLNKSNGVEGTHTIVTSGQRVGGIGFSGSDGVKFLGVADIYGEVDGTPGVDDMPGRLVFATTTDGTNATTEKMRINNAGAVGIGTSVLTGYNLNIGKNITGAITSYGVRSGGVVQSDVTSSAQYFFASPSTVASSFTLGALYAYRAAGGTIGVGSTVTTQIGFGVDSSLTGATNNYGFYSNLASGTGRWNFYADGTAANYFAGNVGIGIAPSGTYKLEVSGNAAATNFVTTSDRNKKTNIATIANALAKVQVLRGVTFDWVADGTASTGLIAQEVERVMPQVVHGDEGSKAVNYGSLVGLLVEAIKEQQTTINQLLARVAQLETK